MTTSFSSLAGAKLRVGMVLPDLRRAGAESAVVNLSRSLVQLGVEVHLIVIGARQEYGAELMDSGIHIHLLDLYRQTIRFYRQDLHWAIRRKLTRFFAELSLPVVHLHLFHALVWAGPAARRAGSLTCYTAHGLDPWLKKNDGISLWRRWLFMRAMKQAVCHLAAVSPSVARHYAEGLSCPVEAITLLPNGLSAAGWGADPGKNSRGRKVIMAGTLYPLKRVGVGILALRELPDAELWVAGDGPQRSELERLALMNGVADRVRFLGVRSDLPELFRAADLFWLLSEREGMPMVALEAMASALPVVATDVPGTRDLLRNEENSLLVALDQPQQVVAASRRLWQDDALRQQVVAAGLATARRFTSESVAREHLACYASLRLKL
ncbi:glycosyltransferase family 4 protein [Candidatus Magnetaquicoccus inordinatus]|uniref:glycosyltransferase family 4 protein n=1 Tax=Candidatus Magnetaquicoccus inordinatus TaxID=2496818 RepID=UPI00102AF393|nr:glycosyltransferase family 4 protein [Candidatus Magnetaquicoccus inordinatus]